MPTMRSDRPVKNINLKVLASEWCMDCPSMDLGGDFATEILVACALLKRLYGHLWPRAGSWPEAELQLSRSSQRKADVGASAERCRPTM